MFNKEQQKKVAAIRINAIWSAINSIRMFKLQDIFSPYDPHIMQSNCIGLTWAPYFKEQKYKPYSLIWEEGN